MNLTTKILLRLNWWVAFLPLQRRLRVRHLLDGRRDALRTFQALGPSGLTSKCVPDIAAVGLVQQVELAMCLGQLAPTYEENNLAGD